VRSGLEDALGPAFVAEPRALTADGRTRADHRPDVDDDGPGIVVALVPAHDEARLIGEALESLAAQTRVADAVIVVADRCTDATVSIASLHAASTCVTVDNRDRKAGALNQVLARLLPRLSADDAVLVMDADSSLSPVFLSQAAHRLREPEGSGARVGGVGGIFLGYPIAGALGHLQNNEYVRYAREIGRRGGRADVLTGTATLFSVRALRDVVQARARGDLPGGEGVYDVAALTEDNELTLALKALGYVCVSPKACTVGTELMPTADRLFHQRLRWQRGALENLIAYGMTRQTLPYVLRQALTYAAVSFVPFFLTTLVATWVATGTAPWSWFWLFVTAFVVLERVWSVKRGGWRAVLLAGLVLPEAAYDLFLHAVYVRALTDVATRSRATWGRRPSDGSARVRHLDTVVRATSAVVVLGSVAGLALVCVRLGIAWKLTAGFVLIGAVQAALRLSGIDALGRVLGSVDRAETRTVRRSAPQGFGGSDPDRPLVANPETWPS
jgi:cellulose synthase/poly-beta-1,6-N-acetylglucosamine synthase-like glycosyltransferase